MKYINTFEKELNKDAKLFSNAIQEYIPGAYIIFEHKTYSFINKKTFNYLVFGKIIAPKVENSHITIDINIIDYVCDNIEESSSIGKSMYFYDNDSSFNKMYINTSMVNVKSKYDNLKTQLPYSDWEMNIDTNKYNL